MTAVKLAPLVTKLLHSTGITDPLLLQQYTQEYTSIRSPSPQYIENQFERIQGTLNELGERIQQLSIKRELTEQDEQTQSGILLPGATSTDQQKALLEDVKTIKEGFAELKLASHALTAPVSIPPPEEMEVTLVPADRLQRLEEYRGEENFWFSFLGIVIGSILGIVINVATGGEMKIDAWLMSGFLFIQALVLGWFALRARRRGTALVKQLLSNRRMQLPSRHDDSA